MLIPIEFVERDFAPSALLAELLIKQFNCECILGPQTLLQRIAQNLKIEFVYFDKSLAGSKSHFVQNLSPSCIYVSSDAEYTGIVNGDYYLQTRFEDLHVERASAILPATNEERRLLLSKYHDKCLDTVFPYRQLAHLKYSDLHSDEISVVKKKFGNFQLVVSNFGGHHRPGGFTELFQWSESHFHNEDNKVRFREKTLKREKLRIDFIEFIQNLAKKSPNINFILRPHPRESLESWQFYNFPENVHISKKESITTMLMCCDRLIHAGCTTAVEAWPMNKEILFFKSRNTEQGVIDFYSRYANLLHDFHENYSRKVSPNSEKLYNDESLQKSISSLPDIFYKRTTEGIGGIARTLKYFSVIRPSYKNNQGKFDQKKFFTYANTLKELRKELKLQVLKGENCLIMKK